MNHHVPEYDVDELYAAASSGHSTQKNMQENEISELVWHNGQLGIQNQRLFRTSPPSKSQQEQQQQHPMEQLPPPAGSDSTTQLFMQEDEMASWLHYPLEYEIPFDQHLNDLLYHPPGPLTAPSSSSTPQQPPADLKPTPPVPQPHHQRHCPQQRPQFRHPAHPSTSGLTQFAHLRPRVPESGQSATARKTELSESAVVDSSDTPTPSLLPVSWSSVNVSGVESMGASGGIAGVSIGVGGGGYMTMSKDVKPYGSSVSGGSATATADPMARSPDDDRKRKGVESSADTFNTDYQGEDMENESYEAKRQCRGTASGKRSRAAEVHNLSERKRRDRINEKMKALGELIPRCTKTDKASLLDEAIDYLKSLQVQVQMMSMGNGGFVPMMFPGVQQYMPVPPMGYGMGMGMETRMNRPMVPFPAVLAGQGYQFPAFPMPPAPPFDPSRADNNPMETVFNPHTPQHLNIYQQYLGSQQMPAHQVSQLPGNSIASTSKTSTSMDPEDNDNRPSNTDMGYKRS